MIYRFFEWEGKPDGYGAYGFAILADGLEDDLAFDDEVHRARTAPGLEQQRAAFVASPLAQALQGCRKQRPEFGG